MDESTYDVIALVVALVLFILAAVNITHPRINLIAAGLAVWVSVPMIAAIRAH